MIQLEETLYGYRIVFPEDVSDQAMQEWLKRSRQLLEGNRVPFRCIFDFRSGAELSGRAKMLWDVGLNLYRQRGMEEGVLLKAGGKVEDLHFGDHFLDMTA